MAKRYTDTDIWKKQRWFKKLSKDYKLAFMYIKDNCNHAGIWNIDILSLCEDTGIDGFNLSDFIEKTNKDFDKITGEPIEKTRFVIVNKGFLWFTSFIRFQYEGRDFQVNAGVPAVRSAIDILKGYNILDEALSKGYFTLKEGLPNPTERIKDKDIDKDKDKELDKRRRIFWNNIVELVRATPNTYGKSMVEDFYSYWTEPNKSKSKLKFEMQATWDLSRRLKTWLRNTDKFGGTGSGKPSGNPAPTAPFILGQKHNAAGQ